MLKKVLDYFIFNNVFVSLCAVALTELSYLMNGFPLKWTPACTIIFFSTFCLYNFHRFSYGLNYSSLIEFKRSFSTLNTAEVITMILSLVMIVAGLLQLNNKLIIWFLIISLPAVLYTVPLLGTKRFRLREIYYLKIPAIGFVWSAVTLIFPLKAEGVFNIEFYSLQFMARALFIMALCIPFELRDVDFEKKRNVITLPEVIGSGNFKIVGWLIVLSEMILDFLMYQNQFINLYVYIALSATAILSLLWIIIWHSNRSRYFYKFAVDGTMMLRMVLVYLIYIS